MRSRSTVYSANTRTAPLAVGAALRGNQTRGEEIRPEDGQRRPSSLCVCLLLVRARAKRKGIKYGATRSAGDYRRKVQLARLCALGGKDMV